MNQKLYSGIIFFFLSFIHLFLAKDLVTIRVLTLSWFSFMLGVAWVCDWITLRIYGTSLIGEIQRNKESRRSFFIVSAIGGFLIEGIAQWLGKLWIYPYFSVPVYFLFFTLGFSAYWLMIAESYLATKAIVDLLNSGRHSISEAFRFEKIIFILLGIIGVILIPASIFLMLRDYSPNYIFDIARPVTYQVNFLYILSMFLGTWFLLEYIEYRRQRLSLIKDMLHNFFSPLISILIASLSLAIIMESLNVPYGYWVYTNWPFEHITFLGLPVSMLLAWPIHYIAFLSLFRAFTGRESNMVWRGDFI